MRIVYFDIDCLRPDHLGCYGYARPTSPNIDSIAREGSIFTRYYCASSPCLPSRTSLVSGRFGVRNGVCSNVSSGANFHLRKKQYGGPQDDNEMFPRQLRRNGMDTISISNFADRHSAYYFMAGWSEFYTPNLKGWLETAEEVNEIAFKWLEDNKGRNKVFLHINYWDTHRPYKMDESWSERFKNYPVSQKWPDKDVIKKHQDISGPFTSRKQFENSHSLFPLMPGSVESRKDFEHMVNGYDTSIAYVDHHIGLIIEKLKKYMWEDTAIVISSDHGDAFGEHGIYSDHVCADECIHHIPLIILWPGEEEKDISDALLYNTDFAPTVCDLLGMDIPHDWDGQSFKNLIEGKDYATRKYLVWDHGLYAVQRAIRTEKYLMIKTYDDMGYGFDEIALYDMENDAYQTDNIAGSQPETVQDCLEKLDEWETTQKEKNNFGQDPLKEILNERSIRK